MRISVGFLGLRAAYTYDPLVYKSPSDTAIFVIILTMWGVLPHILNVWYILDTEVQPKTTKVMQFLLHLVLFGIQLTLVVSYFMFAAREWSLTSFEVKTLILGATLAYAVQTALVVRSMNHIPNPEMAKQRQ